MNPSPNHLVKLWAWTALLVIVFALWGAALNWAMSTDSTLAQAAALLATALTVLFYPFVREKQYHAERRDRFLTKWFLESCDRHTVSPYWREMAEEIKAAEEKDTP